MSTLLSARDLSKAFASNMLFEKVAIGISEGERLGLIGPNGAGKSTLMKILADVEQADGGEVVRRRGLKLLYVAQDDQFEDGATPMSAVTAELVAEDGDRIDVETRAAITLSKLGFENFERPVESLSGGWKKRLSLACALAHDPDVLMLDEPTNHLDLEGVIWLEGFVRQSQMAMIFVTHDRTFLENTASRIIELSPAYPGGTFEANGNYSEFVRRKEAFLEAQATAQSALANKVRRDTAWLQQGIQGRQTRNKTQVEDAASRRAEFRAIKDRNAAPTKTTTIDFQATERKTKKLLALHNIGKTMGEKRLFDDIEITLTPGRRIGLLGVNGSGKTTLLRIMSGDLEPDEGTIKRAADLRIVTFSQHRGTLVPTQTLQEALCPVGDMVDYRGKPVHVTGWAKRFLFERDQLSTFVSNLSGGEQARLLIANLMLEPADVLLLDEPTNDLDIPSLEVLEGALLEFPGAIVLVTHDRFMLERIATEFIGLDDAGGARSFMTYAQWRDAQKQAARQADDAPATKQPRSRSKPDRRKPTWKEQREFESMEATILDAESEVERLEACVGDAELMSDHVRAAETYAALSAAQARVKDLYARWAELEAIHEGG
ncbi:MAG: ABC-F family ATP-binding cassette domain-containing protein [Planctomycetota bacterium]|jgi:ATP-binding cassette subfamily F protein uup